MKTIKITENEVEVEVETYDNESELYPLLVWNDYRETIAPASIRVNLLDDKIYAYTDETFGQSQSMGVHYGTTLEVVIPGDLDRDCINAVISEIVDIYDELKKEVSIEWNHGDCNGYNSLKGEMMIKEIEKKWEGESNLQYESDRDFFYGFMSNNDYFDGADDPKFLESSDEELKKIADEAVEAAIVDDWYIYGDVADYFICMRDEKIEEKGE